MAGWWGGKASLTWEKTGTKAGKVGPCVASLDLLGDILELVMQEFVVSQTCVMLCVTALVIFLWFRVGHTPLVAVLCRHLRISGYKWTGDG